MESDLSYNYNYLGDEVEIGNKGRLKNDGHIGGIKQFDWI